jgi:hypothetical protein
MYIYKYMYLYMHNHIQMIPSEHYKKPETTG